MCLPFSHYLSIYIIYIYIWSRRCLNCHKASSKAVWLTLVIGSWPKRLLRMPLRVIISHLAGVMCYDVLMCSVFEAVSWGSCLKLLKVVEPWRSWRSWSPELWCKHFATKQSLDHRMMQGKRKPTDCSDKMPVCSWSPFEAWAPPRPWSQ
jgi:hypothetical protein